MNSLTWLLAPRRTRSSATTPSNHLSMEQSKNSSAGTVTLLEPSASLSSAALRLGSGPRETEAELVDNMVHSIERKSGTIAANTLERKTSMGLDGELRFGLPGITERRRQIHLDSGPANLSRSNNSNTNHSDPIDRISQSSLPTPLSSSQPPPRSPIKLLSSYSPSYHLVRLLPFRMCVKLFVLIRKFLALFGLRLSPPDPPPSDKPIENKQLPRTRFFRWMLSKLNPKHNSSLKLRDLPTRNKTLVLDLDETLIHSTSRLGGIGGGKTWSNQSNSSAGLKARVVEVVLDGRIVVYHVYKRPWVDFFLKTVSSWYTVVIFTASMREYADPVIDWLDQGRGLIEGRLFRESCTNIQGSYIKDLTVVERDLSKVCLVDNSPISYGLHQANGIPIEGWLNDPKDEGLLELLPMLDSLRFTEDVRRILGLKGFSIKPKKI